MISIWKWECDEGGSCTWAVFLPLEDDLGVSYVASKGFSHLSDISIGEGFWLNANTSQALDTSGLEQSDTSLSLVPGWNLIGLKSPVARSISEFISGKENKIFSIWKWTGNTWAVFLPQDDDVGASFAGSKGFSLLSIIHPGEGFWVNVSESITLE